MSGRPKIIVLDDDPTGSQTVHSCLLLTRWDPDTLRLGLEDESPIFFVLTNTRAMPASQAEAVTREVCQTLHQVLPSSGVEHFILVSRSDSTLRGHYPVETDAMAAEAGPFDAHFLVPAFLEAGRFTRDSIHYLMVNGMATPVHETEFARDSVFAFHHSYLPDYVEEKTQGRVLASHVERLLLGDIRRGSQERLMALHDNCCVVVDAETQSDLSQFAADVLAASSQGKRFLFRSAASILTALADLPPQPIPAESMSLYVRQGQPGAVIVGSHVRKTTEQLEQLLREPGILPIEVNVEQLLEGPDLETRQADLLKSVIAQTHAAHAKGSTPVVFTSRQELAFDDLTTRLHFGQRVSHFLMDVIRGLPPSLGFLISKGGITSNDTLSRGLSIPAVRLLGQILTGCSVVRTPDNHPLFPSLPVVLFPGNVGDAKALATVYRRLSQI